MEENNQQETIIDLQKLNDGIYILKIISSRGTVIKQIIKM